MTEKTLGRDRDQWLAKRALHLTAQHMKYLGRRGGNAHLDIVFRRQLQETFEPRRAVLRALTLIAMGQQEGQPAQPPPFMFATGQELVNHYLSTVAEITKLGLPNNETFGRGSGIAILECHHSFFGQQRIVYLELRLIFRNMLQSRVG